MAIKWSDFRYVVDLAGKHRDELGFVPYPRMFSDAQSGRVRVQRYNREPCGYILEGVMRKGFPLHIIQACIQTDARRLGCASELVYGTLMRAKAARCSGCQARVALDLEATQFWAACGFLLEETTVNPRSGRQIGVYRYRYALDSESDLIIMNSEMQFNSPPPNSIQFNSIQKELF